MHPQSPLLTTGGTLLKKSDDLDVLGVTSRFRAAPHRLGILRKSWRMFYDKSLLSRCFLLRCFASWQMPVFEYCSTVWCSAADTHFKLLDHAVSGALFLLTGGVFESDIAPRRSVAVLGMLYKIRCNRCTLLMVLYPVHRLNDALVCASAGYTRCSGRTSVNLSTALLLNLTVPQTFIPLSMSLWNYLSNPVFDVVGLRVSRAWPMFFCWPTLLYPYYGLLLFFPFSSLRL